MGAELQPHITPVLSLSHCLTLLRFVFPFVLHCAFCCFVLLCVCASSLRDRQVPHSVSLNRRVALYAVTDLLVCSQVRASTHRVPLEYVVTRTKEDFPSTVLMSEFAGSHRILTGAERTNPWHTKHFAAALSRCIDMAPAERRARHQLNKGGLSLYVPSFAFHANSAHNFVFLLAVPPNIYLHGQR